MSKALLEVAPLASACGFQVTHAVFVTGHLAKKRTTVNSKLTFYARGLKKRFFQADGEKT
jgi:hypothetical protein